MIELQAALETERRSREEVQDLVTAAERRFAACVVELDDARAQLETSERARKTAEVNQQEALDRVAEFSASVSSLTAAKKKLEIDVQMLQVMIFTK